MRQQRHETPFFQQDRHDGPESVSQTKMSEKPRTADIVVDAQRDDPTQGTVNANNSYRIASDPFEDEFRQW